jgi:hypothetical protein
MTVIAVQNEGIYYKIVSQNERKSIDNGATYQPLLRALLQNITKSQLAKILQNNNIILFKDLRDCFIYRHEMDHKDSKCLCGKKITNVFTIENTETVETHDIGCECIHNWDLSHFMLTSMRIAEIQRIKDIQDKKDIKLCPFCDRNTTKKKCASCYPRALCRDVFVEWKHNVNKNRELKRKVVNQWIDCKNSKTPLERFISKCRLYIKLKFARMKYEMETYTPLLVPYEDRRRANEYGAFYSKDNKKWFAIEMNPQLETYKITYLFVPFRLKDEAKANGAQWDIKKKQWYCNNETLSKSKFLQNWE